jgi:transcriptional regulator
LPILSQFKITQAVDLARSEIARRTIYGHDENQPPGFCAHSYPPLDSFPRRFLTVYLNQQIATADWSGGMRRRPFIFPLLTERDTAIFISVTEEDHMSKPTDLVQGALNLLILRILLLEPLQGWAIGQRLKQVSGEVLQVSDGSLCSAPRKLEQEGWVTAGWKPSENNHRAKFYSLTRLGRKELEKEAVIWNRLSAAISRVSPLKEA